MNWLEEVGFLLRITRSEEIARRYFVVNGFDGALTMLGLIVGFHSVGNVEPMVAFSACAGAGIALGMSGVSSAYISESAERKKALLDLEQAMAARMDGSAHGRAARLVPLVIAVLNGASPLLVSLAIALPLWLASEETPLPADPLGISIALAFGFIFLLGAYLGRISDTFWVWSGIRAVLIAIVTALLVSLISR